MIDFKMNPHESQRFLGNKVPLVTLVFGVIKMMSTTVGETAADFLIFKLHFGLIIASCVVLAWLSLALYAQFHQNRYVPWIYWTTVVLISCRCSHSLIRMRALIRKIVPTINASINPVVLTLRDSIHRCAHIK